MNEIYSSPVIFCHYGISNYLEYTLLLAKISNPNKKIYLLGDEINLKLANKTGVYHIDFRQFDTSNSILEFKEKFRFIAGNKHGRSEWTRFVFLRWFYINEFIKNYQINSFWHFDSDNFIAIDLFEREKYFSKYDNTEQCGGICLNGFISSSKIVESYTRHIIDLFCDDSYINMQLKKCIANDDFAFTEMAAYNDFKKKYKLNTIRLNILNHNNTFDDCLAISDGMEQTNMRFNNYKIKQLYYNVQNDLFFKLNSTDNYIQINSLNLSWMPFFVIKRIFCLLLRKRVKLLRVLNLFKKENYIKVDFINYSMLDKIIDKILIALIRIKFIS